jgi:hypothetical protein
MGSERRERTIDFPNELRKIADRYAVAANMGRDDVRC